MAEAKILIVDDSEIVLELLRLILEDAGFAVAALTSAFGLNRAIREDRPDLILLDVNMPALKGDKAAAILKQYRFSAEIPVLLHSELDEESLADLVETTGATGYLRKTSDEEELIREIRRWLKLAS